MSEYPFVLTGMNKKKWQGWVNVLGEIQQFMAEMVDAQPVDPPGPGEPEVLLEDERFEYYAWNRGYYLPEGQPSLRVEPGQELLIEMAVKVPDRHPLLGKKKDALLMLVDVVNHNKARDDLWQIHVEFGAQKTRYYVGSKSMGWPGVSLGSSLNATGHEIQLKAGYVVPEGARGLYFVFGERHIPNNNRAAHADGIIVTDFKVSRMP